MILGVVQARMSSTRLPGKVLKPILGRPMLGRQIDRVRRSRRIDTLAVATSVYTSDDAIAAFCAADGIGCFRGALDDVLARFAGAVELFGGAEHVVRLTADCPLIDWTVIDDAVALHLHERADITGNVVVRSYPDGLDVEVMTGAALAAAARDAADAYEREHVTPYLYRHPERFRFAHLVQQSDLAALRWTVDTMDDFRMVEAVFGGLLPKKPDFLQPDILELLASHPEIRAINSALPPPGDS
jgi:spore coat polysaccharide biosynthesis protein SpsF